MSLNQNLTTRHFQHVGRNELCLADSNKKEYDTAVGHFRELFADKKTENLRGKLFEEGFILKEEEDSVFAINFKENLIIEIKTEGFDLKRLKKEPQKSQKLKQPVRKAGKDLGKSRIHDVGGGSGSDNRKWEVGRNGYDKVDDGKSQKW